VLFKNASAMRVLVTFAAILEMFVFASAAVGGGPSWSGRYVVRPGDSLTAIALQHGISLGGLAEANGLDWHKPLLIGTVLRLPGASAEVKPTALRWAGAYVVRSGDTPSGIAAQYGVSLGELIRMNGVDLTKTLLPGMELHVPQRGHVAPLRTYLVRSGDTLSGIASRFGIPLAQLLGSNGIDAQSLLLVGTHLEIPQRSGPSTAPDLAHLVESNPYPHGIVGYDVSYPNCNQPALPQGSFGIVGLNNGRPFTTNPCLAREYDWAQASGSTWGVYINTAYSKTILDQTTPRCAAAGENQPFGPAEKRAYALGCSEGETAWATAQLLPSPPTTWWLDVEPANTWAHKGQLNSATIKGILDYLLTQNPTPTVGIYSHPSYWPKITGNWTTLSLPQWIATSSPDPPGCPAGFTNGPTWLTQHATTTQDLNTTC